MSEAEIPAIPGAKSRDNRAPRCSGVVSTPVSPAGCPGLPAANYPEINAEAALADQHSVFWYHRDPSPSQGAPHLHQGIYQELPRGTRRSGAMPAAPTVRPAGGEQLLRRPVEFGLACRAGKWGGRLLLGNYPRRPGPAIPQAAPLRIPDLAADGAVMTDATTVQRPAAWP